MTENKEQILKNIRNDYNYYTAFEVKKFLEDNIILDVELLKAVDGDAEIVEAIKKYFPPILEKTKETPRVINDYCTEIYFWGMTFAGKTWALAGILNTILNDHLKLYGKEDREKCISSDYLNGLLSVIKKKPINYFPNKTTNDTIRYMNFKLMNNGEKDRKVAFIDLSGDVIEAIAKENYDREHKDLEEERSLIYKLLNNSNRKIHFFFIDYSRNDDTGTDQHVLFNQLGAIFNSKRYFKKTTDYIYFVITKADLISENENLRHNMAIKYFNDNFKSFRNIIGRICQDYEINFGDKYTKGDYSFLDNYILDFSMGEVLFLRMCRFDRKSSQNIVDILLEKVQKEQGIFG